MTADSQPEESPTARAADPDADPRDVAASGRTWSRPLALHLVAAALALVGASLLQLHWPEIRSRSAMDSWWPADAAVVIAATAYLLSVAAVHIWAALWPVKHPLRERLLLGRELISSLIVSVYFAIVIAQGPTSTLLRAGLWRVPPLLLLAATVSLLVLAFTLWTARRIPLRPDSGSSDPGSRTPSRWGMVPTILVVGLLLALAALGRHQPNPRAGSATAPAQQP
ncbi:MAG: hypothetical protein MUF06_21075 [Pirellulaceae bacterium]|jgi:hypothetical protein|nr:hypothetical protein [Pirellulaceae bacterium]